MTAGVEVTIAGRVFRLGAVYAPRPGTDGRRPRRLLQHTADSPLPGGRVTIAMMLSGKERIMDGRGGGRCGHGWTTAAAGRTERHRLLRPPLRPSREARPHVPDRGELADDGVDDLYG